MRTRLFITILAALVMASCVMTTAVQLGDQAKLPPVPWEQVAVYRTADQVPGQYREVAFLSSKGSTMWTTEGGMWKAMQKKAGKMGANAIILDAMSEPSTGAKIAGAVFGVGTNRRGKAIAIFVFAKEEE